MTRFGIIVGIEFAIAAVGAGVVALTGRSDYMACWICAVVGVHFWPLSPVINDTSLHVPGALLVIIAIAAVTVARQSTVAPSAITGALAGISLLVFAGGAAFRAITS